LRLYSVVFFRCFRRERSRQTKPISGCLAGGAGCRLYKQSQLVPARCTNKANRPAVEMAQHAKQSQSGPDPNEGQVPCGKEVRNDSSQNGHGRTNPISGREGPGGLRTPPKRAAPPQPPDDPMGAWRGPGPRA
jgi:hypothetical protein